MVGPATVQNVPCTRKFFEIKEHPAHEIIRLQDPPAQPFSVYHLEQPHHIRIKHGHLGASPPCRANATTSMNLLRDVLQPAINQDIKELFQKYVDVFRDAALNVKENMAREPFKNALVEVDVEQLVIKACHDALENAKGLFGVRTTKVANINPVLTPQKTLNSTSIPLFRRSLQGRRAASPDLPWERRLKADSRDMLSRRSLSPLPKKRPRAMTPLGGPRSQGSPHRNPKDAVRRKIQETWDPARLTTETEFVMGTKANRALGLGATRGRIYMKHPELFKYAGDHEDKKWMVKHNCMAATGGKNTFIMIAEDVMRLFNTEYKDSPGTLPDEFQFFKLPDFVLRKMGAAMMNEKKIRLGGKIAKPGDAGAAASPQNIRKLEQAPSPLRIPKVSISLGSPETMRRLRERSPNVPKAGGSESGSDGEDSNTDESSSYADSD